MTRASGFWEIGGYAKNHPVRLRLPPLHRRGIAGCRYGTTTPSGCACHPSTGGEWSGTMLVQIRGNHPVRLRLPPLHRRGMVRHHAYTDTKQPPRRAAPATPPQEGNGLAPCLYRYEATTPSGCACHPSTGGECTNADTKQPPRRATPATPPQEGNGLASCLCRYEATTPSGYARHPSTGGECTNADTFSTAPFIHFVYGNCEFGDVG